MLSACAQSLEIYMWHHKVLKVVMDLVSMHCEAAKKQPPVTAREPNICFHKEGECPVQKTQITSNMTLLCGACDWRVLDNLKTPLQFTVHIIQIDIRPDIVVCSDTK